MKHTALVGVMDGARDGRKELRGFPWIVAAEVRRLMRIFDFRFAICDLGESFPQIRPLNQAHAEVMLALMLADFVDRHDVWMRQAGGGFRFSFETLDQIRGGQRTGADQLKSDESI